MRRLQATVTSKGQVTVPVELRRLLGVENGGKVEFEVDDAGRVHIRSSRFPTIASLAGAARKPLRDLTWQEVEEEVGEMRAQRHARG